MGARLGDRLKMAVARAQLFGQWALAGFLAAAVILLAGAGGAAFAGEAPGPPAVQAVVAASPDPGASTAPTASPDPGASVALTASDNPGSSGAAGTPGDTRSSGEGPGFVGAPLLAVLGVLGLGVGAAAITLAYVRVTGGGARGTSSTDGTPDDR